ncbi:MAG TPA: hypothetical protein VKU00_09065 [Chthonomonadaceae bacterium]|nr:hypothetical protein [Chthonomonadaceae bacterium]
MSTEPTNVHKLQFSSRCLPGSVAEQLEKERMEEFQRSKAQRLADEARDRPQMLAQRDKDYQAASDANKEQMRKKRVVTYGSRSSASEVLRRNI